MMFNLPQPETVLFALIFGFGLQLWAHWLNRQMQLDDDNPEIAKARIERLKRAWKRLFRLASGVIVITYWVLLSLFSFLGVIVQIGKGETLMGLGWLFLGAGAGMYGIGQRVTANKQVIGVGAIVLGIGLIVMGQTLGGFLMLGGSIYWFLESGMKRTSAFGIGTIGIGVGCATFSIGEWLDESKGLTFFLGNLCMGIGMIASGIGQIVDNHVAWAGGYLLAGASTLVLGVATFNNDQIALAVVMAVAGLAEIILGIRQIILRKHASK